MSRHRVYRGTTFSPETAPSSLSPPRPPPVVSHRLRKKEALLRRMKQDRLKEHETLRRMATADDGEALERRAREAEARADDK